MRGGRLVALALLALTVPVSSLAGLAWMMAELGPEVFTTTWSANLWADLAFTLGTLAVGVAVARLMDRFQPGHGLAAFAVAVPVSFLLHWLVYAASWSLTGIFDPGDGTPGFLALHLTSLWESFHATLSVGWIGLVLMAVLSPVLARWVLVPAPRPPGPDGDRQV